jgi:mRNA-degrading endonuclease toxin of MazEF toxin-antitoxin module
VTLRRGYLYWVRLDKRRPALILSPDARNEHASDVIVIPASTVLREGPWHVRLRKGEAGIPSPSVLKCEQITTLPKDCIDPEALGKLSSARLSEVERAVFRAIGIPTPD